MNAPTTQHGLPPGTFPGLSPHTAPRQLSVPIADYAVCDDATILVTIGLGSCVAIALHSASAGVGALAHVLLPTPPDAARAAFAARYASTAVPVMLRRMRELGAGSDIEARLVGGASMFALEAGRGDPLGTRNVRAARASCVNHGIRIVAEDVGGSHGRSVYFDLGTGSILVRSLQHGDVRI